MWKEEITIETTASKEQIWKQWITVNTWYKSDSGVFESIIYGDFKEGTKGMLKPTSGPKSKFTLTKVLPLESFTSSSALPFAKMHFTHKLAERDGKVFLTHGVKISGPTSFIFSKIIGKKILAELPKAMENLTNMAIQK